MLSVTVHDDGDTGQVEVGDGVRSAKFTIATTGTATPVSSACDVKAFGAKGDGVTDDRIAIQSAFTALAALGGGRCFFPAGHYKVGGSTGLFLESNIEVYGEGYASWIDTDWNVFQGGSIGFHNYGDPACFTYYPANDLLPGHSVTASRAADAAKFTAGQMIMIQSTGHLGSAGAMTLQPYFVEFNVVKAVDKATGTITVEDPINDGYVGIQIAPIYSGPLSGANPNWGLFPRNVTVHDLRLSCSPVSAGGAPWKGALYKFEAYNIWASSFMESLLSNCMVRHKIHDCRFTTIPNAPDDGGLEIATGSHDTEVYNNTFDIVDTNNVGTGSAFQFGGIDEYARRIGFKNNRLNAPGIDFGAVFSISQGASGCFVEDNRFIVNKAERIFQNVGPSDANLQSSIANLPTIWRNNHVECRGGFGYGFVVDQFNVPTQNNIVDGLYVHGKANAPYGNGNKYSVRIAGQLVGSGNVFKNCHIDGSYLFDVPSNVLVENSEIGSAA